MLTYFYHNHPTRMVTIHKAQCGHCKGGQGSHPTKLGNTNGVWSSGFVNLEEAKREATRIANEYKYRLKECGVCKPSKAKLKSNYSAKSKAEIKHQENTKLYTRKWKHRLLDSEAPFNLNPYKRSLQYLFIGTFNPEGYTLGPKDEDYFYGRFRNHFWEILPKTFGDASLKEMRDRRIWQRYADEKNIGITDLLDYVSKGDQKRLLGSKFDDVPLDLCLTEEDIERNIQRLTEIILSNLDTLRKGGIFLTRSTLQGIGKMATIWKAVEQIAKQHNIKTGRLITPARGKSYSGQHKSVIWRNTMTK